MLCSKYKLFLFDLWSLTCGLSLFLTDLVVCRPLCSKYKLFLFDLWSLTCGLSLFLTDLWSAVPAFLFDLKIMVWCSSLT